MKSMSSVPEKSEEKMLMKRKMEIVMVIIPTDERNLSSSHLSLKLNFFRSKSKSAFFAFFDFFPFASCGLAPFLTFRAGFFFASFSLLNKGIFIIRSKTKRS